VDEFERSIRDDLLSEPPQWKARAAELREGVETMYEEKRKRVARWMWIEHAVGGGLAFLGIVGIIGGLIVGDASVATSTSCTVVGAMMFVFGTGWIGSSKLLYWTWNSRLQLERNLKEMHVDVLDMSKRLERIEDGVRDRPDSPTP
jgi:hypothetical protein